MKQITGRIWLGRLKVMFTRISAYFSYINFLLLIATFYGVTGYQYASLWLFVSVTVIGVTFITIVDYFVMLPSEQAFLNQQFVRHQNPIYKEIKDIKEKLNKKK